MSKKGINTRDENAGRVLELVTFLSQVKEDGTWRKWLNNRGELAIGKVCSALGISDSAVFRGGRWAERHKVDFNRWVVEQQKKEQILMFDDEADCVPVTSSNEKLVDEQAKALIESLQEKVRRLEKKVNSKQARILELQEELAHAAQLWHAADEHYMTNVRTIHYGDPSQP